MSICLIAVIGCTEEFTPTPYTYTKLFTGENNKTWQITLFEETLDGTVTSKFMPSCLTDDKFIFYANPEHSYQTTSGSKKCFEDEAAETSDTWTFNNANATLTMILPILSDNALPFIVKDADDNDLEIEIFFDTSNTASYRIHLEAIDEE